MSRDHTKEFILKRNKAATDALLYPEVERPKVVNSHVVLTEEQRQTAMQSAVAQANHDALVELMNQYRIIIPQKHFANWRPTKRIGGDIEGVIEGLTIIATDGVLGIFLTHEGQVFNGHIDWFSGDVKPLYSYEKERSDLREKKTIRRKRSVKVSIDPLELLRKLTNT